MPFNYLKADEIHNSKYNYDGVEFKNVDTKVDIVCPVHGVFRQTPYHHINRGQGCGQCKGTRISNTQRMTLEKFMSKANLIHNNKYDYSCVQYQSAHKHVIIICPKHGEFSQNPNNHLYNKCGCPHCGYNTSKTGNSWLDSLSIPQDCREKVIYIDNQKYKVDALYQNTIYEYFGYFWHGHPDKFDPNDINPRNKVSFGDLYQKTLDKINTFENSSYDFVYTWGV